MKAYTASFVVCTLSVFGQVASTFKQEVLPREVMYRLLFREVASFQAEADRLAAAGKPNLMLRNHHKTVLDLSDRDIATLIRIARKVSSEVAILDAQASAIIEATKRRHQNALKGSPEALVPPPPKALLDLEVARTRIVLQSVDELEKDLTPAQFVYTDSLIRRHIGSNLRVKRSDSQQK